MTSNQWMRLFKICVKTAMFFCQRSPEFSLYLTILDRTVCWNKFFEHLPEKHILENRISSICSPEFPYKRRTYYETKKALLDKNLLVEHEDSSMGINCPGIMAWFIKYMISSPHVGKYFDEAQSLARIVVDEFPIKSPGAIIVGNGDKKVKLDEVVKEKKWKGKKKSESRKNSEKKTKPWKRLLAMLVEKSRADGINVIPDGSDSNVYPLEHKHVAVLKKMCKAIESRGMTFQTFTDLSVKFQRDVSFFLEVAKDVYGNYEFIYIMDIGIHIEDVLDFMEAGCPERDIAVNYPKESGDFEEYEERVKKWLEKNNLDTEFVPPKDRGGQVGSDADSSKPKGIKLPPGMWDLGPAKNPYKTPIKIC